MLEITAPGASGRPNLTISGPGTHLDAALCYALYGLRSQDAKASSEQRNVSLPRGYNSPQDVRAELLRSHHVSLWRPLVLATLDLLSIAVAAVAMRATLRAPLVVTVPVALVLVLFVARQFRALECLVHEASHRNWTRGSQALNDALANVLAAWPVMSHVQDYRRFHQVHHAQLGSTQDADLLRWKRLDLERARQKPPLRFLVYAVRRLPSYVVGWWWAIGVDGATVCRFALWHAVPVVAVAVILSPEAAVTWAIAIAIPLLFVLPVLRFLGEIEEHRYDQVTSVLDATCTNIGFWQLLLLHPHGEAYHTVHHLRRKRSTPWLRWSRIACNWSNGSLETSGSYAELSEPSPPPVRRVRMQSSLSSIAI